MKAALYWLFSLFSIAYSQTPYDDLMQWGRKQKIFLNDNVTLHKANPNEYYFLSKAPIAPNTLIVSIPERLLITAQSLYSKLKSKRLKGIWDSLLDSKNDYIKVLSTKEMMFIATIIEHSMRIQKGSFYKKYQTYINAYPENMDNFPIYYTIDELSLLKNTHFLNGIMEAKASLQEEERIITSNLSHPMVSDDYWKFRAIVLANSLDIHNKTFLIPLLNLFLKDIDDTKINSQWLFNATTNQFEIYTKRDIAMNEMITIQGLKLPNSVALLYYGFTYERSDFISSMIIDVIHPKFKEKLHYDNSLVLYKTSYDLGKENFASEITDIYRILAGKYGYGVNDKGIYQMMVDNLEYYNREYDEIGDSDFVKKIISKRNRINIRRVIDMEKKVFQGRMSYLRSLITKAKTDL